MEGCRRINFRKVCEQKISYAEGARQHTRRAITVHFNAIIHQDTSREALVCTIHCLLHGVRLWLGGQDQAVLLRVGMSWYLCRLYWIIVLSVMGGCHARSCLPSVPLDGCAACWVSPSFWGAGNSENQNPFFFYLCKIAELQNNLKPIISLLITAFCS